MRLSRFPLILVLALVACTQACAPSPEPITPQSPRPTPSAQPADSPGPATEIAGPPTPTSGSCPAGEAGFRQLAPLLDRTLRLDGATLKLITASIDNRSGDWVVDDVIPPWVGLGEDTPTVAASAQASGSLAGSDGMALTAGTVVIFEASLFDIGRDVYPDPSSARPTTLGRDGETLVVPYGRATGRWVLEFHVGWETQCLAGDGIAHAFVETR